MVGEGGMRRTGRLKFDSPVLNYAFEVAPIWGISQSSSESKSALILLEMLLLSPSLRLSASSREFGFE